MINKLTTRRNYARLLEHDKAYRKRNRDYTDRSLRKLTLNLDETYHDIITRVCLLEGISKVEAVRRAINHYSDTFGDETLFPEDSFALLVGNNQEGEHLGE